MGRSKALHGGNLFLEISTVWTVVTRPFLDPGTNSLTRRVKFETLKDSGSLSRTCSWNILLKVDMKEPERTF